MLNYDTPHADNCFHFSSFSVVKRLQGLVRQLPKAGFSVANEMPTCSPKPPKCSFFHNISHFLSVVTSIQGFVYQLPKARLSVANGPPTLSPKPLKLNFSPMYFIHFRWSMSSGKPSLIYRNQSFSVTNELLESLPKPPKVLFPKIYKECDQQDFGG